MNERAFHKYLATGEYVHSEDAAPIDLAAHDRRFHPQGFDPKKDHCQLRESLAENDKADNLGGDGGGKSGAKEDTGKDGIEGKWRDNPPTDMKTALSDLANSTDSVIKDLGAAAKNIFTGRFKDGFNGLKGLFMGDGAPARDVRPNDAELEGRWRDNPPSDVKTALSDLAESTDSVIRDFGSAAKDIFSGRFKKGLGGIKKLFIDDDIGEAQDEAVVKYLSIDKENGHE